MAEPTPSATPLSFLDLVTVLDNFRVGPLSPHSKSYKTEDLVPWALSPSPSAPIIGLLRAPIVEQLIAENNSIPEERKDQRPWFIGDLSGSSSLGGSSRRRISFAEWVDTPSKRTAVMRALCERWRDGGLWSDIVGPKKWRGEDYPVYRDPLGSNDAPLNESEGEGDTLNYAFRMERAACALFGVVTYGVHMTIYVDSPDPEGQKKIWVPKRAKTKQTWPGYLDNSVAGGIPAGYKPFEALVKEAMEEASIEEDIVRGLARCTGSISYFFSTKDGWLQPEVEYLYEIRVPPELADDPRYQPKPLDGEVESFELLPLDEVIVKMRAGLFKPNCAGALLDFLIRHGLLTPDNEPNFLEIQTRLRGNFDYERW